MCGVAAESAWKTDIEFNGGVFKKLVLVRDGTRYRKPQSRQPKFAGPGFGNVEVYAKRQVTSGEIKRFYVT